MQRFRKKPAMVIAERYGDENGQWDDEAVTRIYAFMAGITLDEARTAGARVVDLVQPTGAWDPARCEHDLRIWDGTVHKAWLPLRLGEWVVKGVKGEFYPVGNEVFETTFESVEDE